MPWSKFQLNKGGGEKKISNSGVLPYPEGKNWPPEILFNNPETMNAQQRATASCVSSKVMFIEKYVGLAHI